MTINMDRLAQELLLKIFSYLSAEDLASTSMTCRIFSKVGSDKILWESLTRKFCRKKSHEYNEAFLRLVHEIALTYNWRLSFKLLLVMENKWHPYFWDDIQQIKEPFENEDEPLSVIVYRLVKALDISKMDDFMTFTKDHWIELSLVMTSIPEIPISNLLKTLLDIAVGPYKTKLVKSSRITTATIRFLSIIKNELDRHTEKSLFYGTERFIKDLVPTISQVNKEELFGMSQKNIELTVLNIIFHISKHIALTKVEIKCIEKMTSKMLPKFHCNGEATGLCKKIKNLLQHLLQEKIPHHDDIQVDFFNVEVTPYILALQMLHKEQLKLANIKLNDYLKDNIIGRPNQTNHRDNIFQRNAILDEDLKTGKIQNIQENSLVNYLLKRFTDLKQSQRHSLRVHFVHRLISVAEVLYQIRNYKSFKDIMEAIRGILTFKIKTGLSWFDVEYTALKKFVTLETILTRDNNFQVYRNDINSTSLHAIPILAVHLNELKAVQKTSNANEQKISCSSYLHFDVITNSDKTKVIATIYSYFNRR